MNASNAWLQFWLKSGCTSLSRLCVRVVIMSTTRIGQCMLVYKVSSVRILDCYKMEKTIYLHGGSIHTGLQGGVVVWQVGQFEWHASDAYKIACEIRTCGIRADSSSFTGSRKSFQVVSKARKALNPGNLQIFRAPWDMRVVIGLRKHVLIVLKKLFFLTRFYSCTPLCWLGQDWYSWIAGAKDVIQ